jgi:hypothetical protein
MSSCIKPTENFPFRDATFDEISKISQLIKSYAKKYNVPSVAVAGSIADELNTRVFPKNIIDWFQDDVLINA